MSFIRFSNYIIHPAWIQTIEIVPTGYKIMMSHQHMSGWLLAGSGFASSINKPLWISKEKEPVDYEKMTKWIEKNSS
jgi:hypothetical protein